MGRMHSRGKGISASALPYKRTPPSWLKISSQDVEENICKFAKKGMTPSQIGVILRDSHGIAQVKSVTGSKILRILKAHGLAPEIPEDLYHLIKKAVAIRKHLERNRKDKDSKFRLILVESRIHRLARYYKKTKKLPPVWKYNKTWRPKLFLTDHHYGRVYSVTTVEEEMAVGLRLFTERAGDGAGVPVLDSNAGEELIHVQPGVSVVLANRPPESPGTLYISSKQVLWLSDVDRAKGYVVDFLSVSLHAISRDPEAYPSPCIYAQIDTGDEDGDQSEGSDTEDNGTDNGTVLLSKVTEMRLVPSDSNQLDTLFEIFCKCAEMNPEPVEEEEERHNWIFSADQMQDEGAGTGLSQHYNLKSTMNDLRMLKRWKVIITVAIHKLFDPLAASWQLHIDDFRFTDIEQLENDNSSGVYLCTITLASRIPFYLWSYYISFFYIWMA
ncbi:hypothetical protein RHMOL_Rhmol03G0196700 [Rhododendron molle]|uniref:Uncharacterized protein n=1 Tax=Rhododendron molle TaxID=49168 RepID=A0ACC0PGE2_RHOML|nr:hypothetical protein RHMOL_Rhmol03G0196700 [Rhododendron molle]